jgi:hypothetical protein
VNREPEARVTNSPTTRAPISVAPEERPPFPNQAPGGGGTDGGGGLLGGSPARAAVMQAREAYQRLRTAHLKAVQGTLEDHVERLDWSREQIERHQTERLRSLLTYARERSPFMLAD